MRYHISKKFGLTILDSEKRYLYVESMVGFWIRYEFVNGLYHTTESGRKNMEI